MRRMALNLQTRMVVILGSFALLITLSIGGVAGWLAGLIMKGRGFGVLANIGIGIVGAFLGGFVFRLLGLAAQGAIGA